MCFILCQAIKRNMTRFENFPCVINMSLHDLDTDRRKSISYNYNPSVRSFHGLRILYSRCMGMETRHATKWNIYRNARSGPRQEPDMDALFSIVPVSFPVLVPSPVSDAV